MSTVGFDNTSEHLSGLDGSGTWWCWLNFLGFWLLSKNGLGSGLSNLVSEVFPVSTFVIGDSLFKLREDIVSINYEVFSNVVSETSWAVEDGNHLIELVPVSGKA